MPFSFIRAVSSVALVVFALASIPSVALADGSLRGEYFILPSTYPDVGHGADDAIVRGLIEKRLGPDGLPVVTAHGRTYNGPSGPIRAVNAAGELLWFSNTGQNGIRREKVVTEKLPFVFDGFYPDGQNADGGKAGYRTVHWSGSFVLAKPQSVGFKLGSDDDSWVFVDGSLVVDNGGVKPVVDAPYTVTKLAAGSHTFDVFYADRHGAGANLHLSTAFPLVPRTPPATKAAAPPPKLATVASAASMATQIKKTGHVAVYGIHFAFDRADIAPDSSAVLAEVAKVLRGDPALRIRIEGHTDDVGNANYNRDLSLRRADAVKDYLVTKFAIAPARLTTRGFGPDRPVASNATDAGRAKNRRVELARE